MNTLPTREEIKWWGKGIVWDIFLGQYHMMISVSRNLANFLE